MTCFVYYSLPWLNTVWSPDKQIINLKQTNHDMILKGHSKFFSLISNPILTTKIDNLWKKLKEANSNWFWEEWVSGPTKKKLGDLGVGENVLGGVEDSTI